MSFILHTAVITSVTVFCGVTPCGLVGGYTDVSDEDTVDIIICILKTQTICSSEMSVNFCNPTRRHSPEDHDRHLFEASFGMFSTQRNTIRYELRRIIIYCPVLSASIGY
jgi:hypothetical protein